MAKPAAPSARSVVRELLTARPTLSTDEVIDAALARGVKGDRAAIRHSVHNVRGLLRKEGATPAPAAKPAPVPTAPSVAAATPAPATGLAGALANVAEVHAVALACGGEANARRAAEAVRACGGVDAFLAVLDVVAGIRGSK